MRHAAPVLLVLCAACARDLALPDRRQPLELVQPVTAAAPGERVTIAARGGARPYTWSIAHAASGTRVTVDALTGDYVAGDRGMALDLVQVSDAAGATAVAQVDVGPPLDLAPARGLVAPGGTLTLVASGGKGPYSYTIVSGPGRLVGPNGSTYQAPAVDGCATPRPAVPDAQEVRVRATDVIGKVALEATITVTRGLDLYPAVGAARLAPGATVALVAAGGQPPYTFAAGPGAGAGAASGGGFPDPGRGSYVAGATGDVVDVVRVTDAIGQVRCLDVAVGPRLSLAVSTTDLRPGKPAQLLASGGEPPYGYRHAFKGNRSRGAVDPAGTYVPGPNAGAVDVVEVTDAAGTTARREVAVGPLQIPAGPANACAIVELSGDGRGDVFVAQSWSPHTGVFAARSNGLGPMDLVEMAQPGLRNAFPYDLDGDGRADVVVNADDGTRVWITAPDGRPVTAVTLAGLGGAQGAGAAGAGGLGSAADVGRALFFAARPLTREGLALCGAGGGIGKLEWPSRAAAPRAPACAKPLARAAAVPSHLAAGDWNGDGVLDVAWLQRGLHLSHGPAFADDVVVALPDGWGQGGMWGTPPLKAVRRTGAAQDELLVKVASAASSEVGLVSVSESPIPTASAPFIVAPSPGLPMIDFAVAPSADAGRADVVAWFSSDGNVVVFPFPFPAVLPPPALPPRGYGVDCAGRGDVDGDGVPDLVMGSASVPQLEVVLGDRAGGFGGRVHHAQRGNVYGGAVADVDGDGEDDVVAATLGPGVEVMYATSGALAVERETPMPVAEYGLVARDVDGDGRVEVVYQGNAGGLWVLGPRGDGTFDVPAAPVDVRDAATPAHADRTLLFRVQALRARGAWRTVLGFDAALEQAGVTPMHVVRLDLARSWTVPSPYVYGSGVLTPDLDGDGTGDVVIAQVLDAGGVRLWRAAVTDGAAGTSVGAFVSVGELAGTGFAVVIAAGTFPVGGKERAVFVVRDDTGASVAVVGDAGVTRAALPGLALGTATTGVAAVGDLDGDAVPDLAVSDAAGLVHLFRGDGAGGFDATEWKQVPGGPVVGVLRRRTGPGDLLVRAGVGLVVLRNRGGGDFGS